MKFKSKPFEVEAIQFTGDNKEAIDEFIHSKFPNSGQSSYFGKTMLFSLYGNFFILKLNGWVVVDSGSLTTYTDSLFKERFQIKVVGWDEL